MADETRDQQSTPRTKQRDLPELGIGKGDEGDGHRRADGPLDGSTSGTIGGGGPDVGGSTKRPAPQGAPETNADDAASGRLAPDAIGATAEPDELGPGPSDVTP